MSALTPPLGSVLVVDDEVELMTALQEALTAEGYQAAGVSSGRAALEALQTREFDLLLTDLMMPGMDGIALLKAGLAIDPHLVGLVMTGQGTVPTAVEAMKIGAFDYLLKPFRLEAMLPVLGRALEVRRLRLENIHLRETVAIYNLSQVIAFSLDTRLIVDKIADAVVQQVDADEVSLMRVTPAGDGLYVAAVRGEGRDGLLGQRVPLQQGVAGWVARQTEPLILNGEVHDPRFAPVRPRADIRSAISMPLLAAGQLVGVLNVNSLRQRRPFTLGQVKALSILTSTAASALHSAALHEESERLRHYSAGIVETMAEGLTLEDAHGQITYANARLLALLGYAAGELIGQPWHKIVARREHARVAEQASQDSPGQANTYESTLLAKDGREIPVLVSTTPFEQGGQRAGILATFADLTERKQAEAALAQSNDLLARAEQVGHTGSWEFNLATNREVWSDGLYRIFGCSPNEIEAAAEAFLDFVHPDDRDRVRQTIDGQMQDNLPVEYECRIVRPDSIPRVILAKSEFVFDDRGEPARKIGIITDITERKQRERELEAIAAVSTALRAATTRAEMTPVILDQSIDLLNASGSALDMFDALTGEAVIEAARGAWAPIAGLRIPPDQGIMGQVVANGRAYVHDDIHADPRFLPAALARDIRAAACVPLIAQGRVIGGLWVGRQAPITSDDLRLLTAVADIAANAIYRASLYEQTGQRLQRLAALREIDIAISANLDLRVTLDVLLGQVMSQLRVDAASVLLLNPHSWLLQYAASRGLRARPGEPFSLRLGQGYAGRVALDRRRLSLPDLALEPPDPSRESLLNFQGLRAYHGVPLIAKGQVQGVLEVFHRAPQAPDADWLDFLEALAGQAAIAIDNTQLFNDLQRSNLDLSLAYEATIEGWSRALDLRDKETEGHSRRVTDLTLALARALGIRDEELVHIRRGALLHDIGKMGVPDSILLKPGPLTEDEWVIMRQHPIFAYDMLWPIQYLRLALDIPYCHHEKWDGTGYPRKLKGESIPLAARIFAVVDVWDALRSDRPYRAAWPEDMALEYIRAQVGKHFDPDVVAAFVQLDRSGTG